MVIILGNAANVYLSKLWFKDKHKNTLALMMFLVFFLLRILQATQVSLTFLVRQTQNSLGMKEYFRKRKNHTAEHTQ